MEYLKEPSLRVLDSNINLVQEDRGKIDYDNFDFKRLLIKFKHMLCKIVNPMKEEQLFMDTASKDGIRLKCEEI